MVNPNFNNEASRGEDCISGHGHCNQGRNAAVAERTEAPNLNQEAAVSAAALTQIESPQLRETSVDSLHRNPLQKEAQNTVDAGATDNESAQPPTVTADRYDHCRGK